MIAVQNLTNIHKKVFVAKNQKRFEGFFKK